MGRLDQDPTIFTPKDITAIQISKLVCPTQMVMSNFSKTA